MPEKENRPADNGAVSRTTGCTHYIAGLRRRQAATYRLPVLDCGHVDPWTCRPSIPTRGYAEAAQHLLDVGLTPAPNLAAMRDMWRHGGDEQRAALAIADRWEAA